MDVKVTEINDISKEVLVVLDAPRVDKAVNKRLKEMSKSVKMPGFRKGKVPIKQIQRKYGPSARFDAIDKLVQSTLRDALAHDDVKGSVHFSQPELVDGLKGPGGFSYKFTVESLPEITPQNYAGVEVQVLATKVDEERVDAEIQRLVDEATDVVPVEDRTTVEAGDVVVVTYKAQGEGEVEQIFAEDQTIDLGDANLLDGFADGVVGLEKDVKGEAQVTLPDTFAIEALAGQKVTLDVTVSEIKAMHVPELDDEFARTHDAESMDALRASIRERLEKEETDANESDAKRRLIVAIREQNPVTIPPLYLDAQAEQEMRARLMQFTQKEIDPSQMNLDMGRMTEAIKPQVSTAIHETLVLRAIGKAESIEVTDEDIDGFLEARAEEAGVPLARLKAEIAAPEARGRLRSQLLLERVLDFVWSKATIVPVDELPAEASEDAEETAAEDASEPNE